MLMEIQSIPLHIFSLLLNQGYKSLGQIWNVLFQDCVIFICLYGPNLAYFIEMDITYYVIGQIFFF